MSQPNVNNCYHDSAIILGAGPVGLWSAIQMLENNFANNVIVLEKRFNFNQERNKWLNREMVIQFHRSLLSVNKKYNFYKSCPTNVYKEGNESHRAKYNDLEHMSIKNMQSMLFNYLKHQYNNRFSMLEMQKLQNNDLPEIVAGTGQHNLNLFNDINIGFLLDATGYHSAFMNKIMNIEFEGNIEYGSALKITWPEHEMQNKLPKAIEFHDCHAQSDFFNKGFSSVAEFSAPIPEFNSFLEACGYNSQEVQDFVPFLERDKTPFSIKLFPFIQRIINSKQIEPDKYTIAKKLFSDIRRGGLYGISGFNFIKYLRLLDWLEADALALVIYQIIDNNMTSDGLYEETEQNKQELEKIRVVFVPSRIERWLKSNENNIDISLTFQNKRGDKKETNHRVLACAAGDSLASSDFRHGLGINRGIHTANRIFRDGISPEQARKDLITNSYFELSQPNDENIFNRAIHCRDWLLSTGTDK